MSPRVTGLYKMEIREKIIRAAIESFAQTGFERTKMDDIARRLDLSKGTLYLYFKSKEDLFFAICEYYLALLKREFSILFAGLGDIVLDAEHMYDNFRKLEHGGDRVMLEMIIESTRNQKLRKILYEHRLKVNEAVASYLKTQQEKGSINSDTDVVSLASAFVCLYDGLTLSKILGLDDKVNKAAWMAIVKASIAGVS